MSPPREPCCFAMVTRRRVERVLSWRSSARVFGAGRARPGLSWVGRIAYTLRTPSRIAEPSTRVSFAHGGECNCVLLSLNVRSEMTHRVLAALLESPKRGHLAGSIHANARSPMGALLCEYKLLSRIGLRKAGFHVPNCRGWPLPWVSNSCREAS